MRLYLTAPALFFLLLQADCASNNPTSPAASVAACTAEEAQYDGAFRQLTSVTQSISQSGYLQTLRQSAPAPEASATLLTADIDKLTGAVDQLNGVFAGLKSCRIAHAEALRAGGVTLDRLKDERAAYRRDLDRARTEVSSINLAQGVLQQAARQIEAASPSGRLKAAKALAAPPPALQPYVAVVPAGIHAKPDIASPEIAQLRRGLRAEGPGGDPRSGWPRSDWIAIVLNDGSMGYVQADLLEAVTSNPSAALASRRSDAERDKSDPFVALAIAAERTLPNRIVILTSTIETANDAAVTAYGT